MTLVPLYGSVNLVKLGAHGLQWNVLKEKIMPFFSLLVVLFLPEPEKYYWAAEAMGKAVLVKSYAWVIYDNCRTKSILWHKSQLEKFNRQYQLEEAREKKAIEQGIGPFYG